MVASTSDQFQPFGSWETARHRCALVSLCLERNEVRPTRRQPHQSFEAGHVFCGCRRNQTIALQIQPLVLGDGTQKRIKLSRGSSLAASSVIDSIRLLHEPRGRSTLAASRMLHRLSAALMMIAISGFCCRILGIISLDQLQKLVRLQVLVVAIHILDTTVLQGSHRSAIG